MKNTLKKLLIAAGICVASTSAFAENIFLVQVDNTSNHAIKINWSHESRSWDEKFVENAGAIPMSGETIVNPNMRAAASTADSYTWGNPDMKYFSITVQDPGNPSRGKKYVFGISNEHNPLMNFSTGFLKIHDGNHHNNHKIVIKYNGTNFDMEVRNTDNYGYNSCDWDSAVCWQNFAEHDTKSLNEMVSYDDNVPAAASQPVPGTWSIGAGNCSMIPQWNPTATYSKSGTIVTYNNLVYKNDWWTKNEKPGTSDSRGGYVWKKQSDCKITGGAPYSASLIPSATSVPATVPAPKGTYDFGQWKAGEYPVVYSPKEIHPFVTYNGKGYVACNGDTAAKDVPGKSDAWKEVNGTLGNTCGYTVHSYKKQSTTPSVAKSAVSFW